MKYYSPPNKDIWSGRTSESKLYFHEKIECIRLNQLGMYTRAVGLLGYGSDIGVVRNKGREGSAKGPNAIRQMLARLANHTRELTRVVDVGDINAHGDNLEEVHQEVTDTIKSILSKGLFPIVMGGGHDLAYAHYKALRNHLTNDEKLGIINFDAHFDLRVPVDSRNSGTPFFQIATEEGKNFNYMVLGIQKTQNTRMLFEAAEQLDINYMLAEEFTMTNEVIVRKAIKSFLKAVDQVYLTIDLDGFSSTLAPGVSAPSPFGFGWEVAYFAIDLIKKSGKLASVDIVELNPTYDLDNRTARLAAGLVERLLI